MSDALGPRLRAERERRKISLVTVANSTKIAVTLLEGLERDDLSRWPVGIFRRSFFRVYVEAIGLDPEPLLREFLAVFPDPSEPQNDERRAEAATPPDPSALRLTLAKSWFPFAGGVRLVPTGKRLLAAAWDSAVLISLAAGAFVMTGQFWLPLGVASLIYYVGGILVLGNSPGICLFGPVRDQDAPVIVMERPDEGSPDDRQIAGAPKNRRDPLKLVRRA